MSKKPRVMRLDELTDPQRRLVNALFDANAKAMPSTETVWSVLETLPGYTEELKQARAELEGGKGAPFRDIRPAKS